jgi:hypothetical protein
MVKTPAFALALLCLAACSAPQVAPPPTAALASASATSPKPRLTPAGMPLGGDDCVGHGAGSCAAGLTCFLLESPNGRGVCAVEATIDELATRTRYEGALVGVRHASFGSSGTVCTDMACDCCNSCTKQTHISDGTDMYVLAARSSGEPYVIKADECAIKTMSFGLPSGTHTIVGIARSNETLGRTLEIRHLIAENALR